MDKLTPDQRHENMSHIHGKDTKPEIIVRKYLFNKGLRYRKNDKSLPGHPDIVLPKYKTVVFVNGCFWHGHEGCKYFRFPKSNTDYWKTKIETNIARDKQTIETLESFGWNVIMVWECELNKKLIDQTLSALFTKIVTSASNEEGHECKGFCQRKPFYKKHKARRLGVQATFAGCCSLCCMSWPVR